MKRTDAVNKVGAFLETIDTSSRLAILCDSDPDGICSGVILTRALAELKGLAPSLVIPASHNVDTLDDAMVEQLRRARITHFMSADLAIDQKTAQLTAMESFCRVLIFDHHKLYNDVNSQRITLIKPQLFQKKIDPSQYCASKLCFDMLSEFTDLQKYDWMAVVGILADSNVRTWVPFVRKAFKRLNLRFELKKPFNNPLGRMCNLMAYYEIFAPGKVERLYTALRDAKSYKHALNSEIRKAERVEKEVDFYLKNYAKYAEKHDDLLLITIKPHFRIGSIVATRLSNKLQHTTIVIAQEMDGRMFVSARRQDFKVAVNDLLEQGVAKMKESSAGGHIPAAGARFPKEEYPLFSERIILHTKRRSG